MVNVHHLEHRPYTTRFNEVAENVSNLETIESYSLPLYPPQHQILLSQIAYKNLYITYY